MSWWKVTVTAAISSVFDKFCAHFVTLMSCGLFLFSVHPNAATQDYAQGVGAPTYTTAEPVELGFVNASNGNLHMEIPVGSFPQRGERAITYKFVYDSRIWYLNSGTTWDPNTVGLPWAGWRFINSAGIGAVNWSVWSSGFCNVNGHQTLDQGNNNFSWQGPDGTTHYFDIRLQFSNNCGGQVAMCGWASAADDSGYFMIQNDTASCQGQWPLGTTVLGPDGSRVFSSSPTAPGFKDANGNYYSTDANGNTIDTLGRTPVIVTSNCGTNQTCYDVLNSQGGSTRSRWIVTTQTISVHTAFGQSGKTEYSGTLTAIQSIKLPDGTTYQFTYNSGSTAGHYGEITGITTPNGGGVSYGYTVYSDALRSYNRWVTSHTSGGGQTTYALGAVNTTNQTQNVTVTKPSGDYKVYSFVVNNTLTTLGAWKNQVNVYSSGGTLLKNISETYETGIGHRTSGETVTMQTPTGAVSKQTTYAYNNLFTAYPGTIKEWNYYTGSPSATADRTTTITYLSDTNTAYAPDTGQNILNLPSSIAVIDSGSNVLKQTNYSYDGSVLTSKTGVMQHDDTNFGTSFTARGNRTQVQQVTTGTSLLTVSTMTYDTTGQMLTSKDANNNTTTYGYTDCYRTGNPPTTYTPSQPTNAFPTTITLPVSGSTTSCYYYNTGKTAWSKDQNSAQTSYFYVAGSSNDPLDRLITKTLPTGGWVLNNFSTPATTVDTYTSIQTASPSAGCTSCRHDESIFDGLGRPTSQILVGDPDGQTTVRTDYDTSGRVLDTSHSYRSISDPTYGLETTTYDGMNRVTQITHQDATSGHTFYGATVGSNGGQTTQLCPAGTCHLGYPTLLKDESGKIRQYWTDGFGNVVEVDEPMKTASPGSWGSSPTVTYYIYDLLGNLKQATAANADNGECTRSYQYDALSRMTQSIEPEVGNGACTTHAVTYSYSASGGGQCSGNPSLLCSRTDERPATVSYSYDGLNRLTGKTYSDTTSPVSYLYDQTSYNGLTIANGKGRRTGMSDVSGTTAWSYDANGNVTTEKRSLGSITKTSSYAYNLDNSLKQITYPSGRVVNYSVSNAQRTSSAVDGNGTQYALSPSSGWEYEPNGALAAALYGKSGTFAGIAETRAYNNRLQLTGIAATSTGGMPINLAPAYNSNGEISTITNSLDTGRTQTFTYDSLSRITSGSSQATSGSNCWGQSYTIDNIGNLSAMTVTKCSSGSLSSAVNQNNQLLSGYNYDAAGNLTSDGTYTYSYNGENEMIAANGVTYQYDGDHRRVSKSSGTLYWRDLSGNTLAETDASGSDVNEYVFFAGRRVARIDSAANVYYYQADQIGSVRAVVNSSGTLCFDADYTPYGLEVHHTNACAQNYKFTGYERDPETGLDYAMNRYYNYRIGRFMNPDPLGMISASLSSPQSLNLYSYVLNNPVSRIDPKGEYWLPGMGDYNVLCWENGFQNGIHNNQNCPAPGNNTFDEFIWGNDLLDAIAGQPGTYLTVNMYGQLGFGFSSTLWAQTEGYLDMTISKLESSGQEFEQNPVLTVIRRDLGALSTETGLVPEWNALQAEQGRILKLFPKEAWRSFDKLLRAGAPPALAFNYILFKYGNPTIQGFALKLADATNYYFDEFCAVFAMSCDQ